MDAKQAVELLRELIYCETEMVKQVNSRRGGITKKLAREERKAVDAIFKELVGTVTTDAEYQAITE